MLFLLMQGDQCKVVFRSQDSVIAALVFFREEYPQYDWKVIVAEEIEQRS